MWNRLRQGRFSGDARQSRMEGEGMVQRKDLANIQRWEKGIEAALDLRLKFDFGQVLKRAFEEWREIPALTRQSEAADIVLMDDDTAKIAKITAIARKTIRIVRQNIVFALAVKALVLVLGAFGMANMWEAVFADVGVAVIAILNAMRALKTDGSK